MGSNPLCSSSGSCEPPAVLLLSRLSTTTPQFRQRYRPVRQPDASRVSQAGDHEAGRGVAAAGAPHPSETRHCAGDPLPLVRSAQPWRAAGSERSVTATGWRVAPHADRLETDHPETARIDAVALVRHMSIKRHCPYPGYLSEMLTSTQSLFCLLVRGWPAQVLGEEGA
jgi:hypothetical protein